MLGQYYFMYVNTVTGNNPSDEIEKALASMEWARLRGGDIYILYSQKRPDEIYDMIKPILGDSAHILVGKFDMNSHRGWLSTASVEWLNRART
jgi:hypothetical protein